LALVLTVEYHCDNIRIIYCFPDLAGAGLSIVAMLSKLTQAAPDDIQLQLEAGTRPNTIVNVYRISERQVYKMRENLKIFIYVVSDPAQFQVQSRPRLITPNAREGAAGRSEPAYLTTVRYSSHIDCLSIFHCPKIRNTSFRLCALSHELTDHVGKGRAYLVFLNFTFCTHNLLK
jgi:hypothetical protein